MRFSLADVEYFEFIDESFDFNEFAEELLSDVWLSRILKLF